MIHEINHKPRELTIAELKKVLAMRKFWHKQAQIINKKLQQAKS